MQNPKGGLFAHNIHHIHFLHINGHDVIIYLITRSFQPPLIERAGTLSALFSTLCDWYTMGMKSTIVD